VLTAYASLNGVEILEETIKRAQTRLRTLPLTAQVAVGIDRKRTSYKGLEKLLQLKGRFPNLQVSVVQDARIGYTFHPKVYDFESASGASLWIGSNNLTKWGLTSNYEFITVSRFDYSQSGRTEHAALMRSLDPYFTPVAGSWVQELTYTLLAELLKKGWITTKEREKPQGEGKGPIFGKGSAKSTKANMTFSAPPVTHKIKLPGIALELTHWDTDYRHSETQIPRDVINNGFFPNDELTLVLPGRVVRKAKLSHYTYHSRVYNKEILDRLHPKPGDILILTRLSPKIFRADVIQRGSVSPSLSSKLSQRKGKGKRWGWV
jgi:hypothetical protein